MRSEEDSRKRSKQARRQERDARGRFCSAAEGAPGAGAIRRIPSAAKRKPEDSAIPSAADSVPEASARWDRSAAERALRACRHREIRSGSGSGVAAKKKFLYLSSRCIPHDDDSPSSVRRNSTIEAITCSSEESSGDDSCSEAPEKVTFWELHKEVAVSQDNVKWLKDELKKEKARKKKLHAALIDVAEEARNN